MGTDAGPFLGAGGAMTVLDLTVFAQQGAFLMDQHPFVAAVCGIGGGKSEAGAIKTLQYVANPKHAGALGMVTAPTYKMLTDATMRSIEKVFPKGWYEINRGEMRLKFKTGSEVLFRSTDDPETLRGPNLAFVWMDEAALSPEQAFLILQGRLRQPNFPNQMWLTTTPRGYNWVYRRFKRDKSPDYSLHQWPTTANTFLPPSFVAQLRASYGEQFALQELGGEFVLMSGGYFHAPSLKAQMDDCRTPLSTRKDGIVKIWKPREVARKYVAGGDLAWGKKGSYSCLMMLDWQTGEQVAEIHGKGLLDEMAEETVKLCREYNDAFVGVEWAGDENEGQLVINKMVELGYGNRMYYRDHEADKPKLPGWVTNGTTRPVMLAELDEAFRGAGVRIHCLEAVEECMSFVRDSVSQKPQHAEGAYDDHVLALALAWQMRGYAKFNVGKARVAVSFEARG